MTAIIYDTSIVVITAACRTFRYFFTIEIIMPAAIITSMS